MLDVYSIGIRTLFATDEALQSIDCTSTLFGDFRSHPYGVDIIERLNSELTAGHPHRAPPRKSVNAFRHNVLKQSVVIHKSKGGRDPLGPGHPITGKNINTYNTCFPVDKHSKGARTVLQHSF